MKHISKIFNMRVFIYTFLIWLNLNISGIQNIYFSEGKNLTIIVVKILHIFFLYAILSKIHSLYVKRHLPKVKNEIIISLIYFCILTILLILVWPGIWGSDDITVLRNAEWYKLTPWQHFFSGLFQILCLQTIPIPSGVMIIQIIISSLIVGYCISNISRLYGKTKKQVIILQIVLGMITLFPPIIMYILSGFRMGMYSYLELALITKIIILYKEQKKATNIELLKISFLTIIITCWRTEAFYYPIFILILYFILGKKIIAKRVAIIGLLIIMIINGSIGKLNNSMIDAMSDTENSTIKGKDYNSSARKATGYSLTATMEPVTQLLKISDESDKKEIDIIDKVINVKYILEHPENTGETNFWAEGVVREYTEEEYENYLKAYLKLAIKYTDVTLKSMWNIFEKTGSGIGENSKQTTRNMVSWNETLTLFEIGERSAIHWNAVTSKVLKYKTAINENIRNLVIRFLNGTDSNSKITPIHNIFWNLFIPFTLLLICLIYKLITKDWFMIFLILTIFIRVLLVFMTAPAPYFMYYLSAYLCSYIISVIVIYEFITKSFNKCLMLEEGKL